MNHLQMDRRTLLKNTVALLPALYLDPRVLFDEQYVLAGYGPFKPAWNSLQQYQVPEWFKNAKFGIWAHWGPQCQPEFGDWYARGMYQEGSSQYKYHLEKYGHPSKFGFKDVINEWMAENWNPDELIGLYKEAGARYFMALANHHDNFDNYNSSHQPWNSVRTGPKKDIIGGWEKAARKHGLKFGASVHAAHAWSWYEVSQRYDKDGPLKGVPYDGNISRSDGAGKWWEGLDPRDLYAQQHPLSENSWDNGMIHRQWNWGNSVAIPSKKYCKNFYKRTIELIDNYNPDLLYFDDTALPLWPVGDEGLRIAAHYYNRSYRKNGSTEVVLFGKILDEMQRKCMVWDIERGQSNTIEPYTWQTDTCIGSWHYDRRIFDAHRYKSAKTVIHTLVDVVSKNGNLLLSIPLKGDGALDSDELEVVKGITAWMKINSESIYDTRPYKVYGEGPAMSETAELSAQGFNEGKGKPFTAADFRFAVKGDVMYATSMGKPSGKVLIRTLQQRDVQRVDLLGYKEALPTERTEEGLVINLPEDCQTNIAAVFKIYGVV